MVAPTSLSLPSAESAPSTANEHKACRYRDDDHGDDDHDPHWKTSRHSGFDRWRRTGLGIDSGCCTVTDAEVEQPCDRLAVYRDDPVADAPELCSGSIALAAAGLLDG